MVLEKMGGRIKESISNAVPRCGVTSLHFLLGWWYGGGRCEGG